MIFINVLSGNPGLIPGELLRLLSRRECLRFFPYCEENLWFEEEVQISPSWQLLLQPGPVKIIRKNIYKRKRREIESKVRITLLLETNNLIFEANIVMNKKIPASKLFTFTGKSFVIQYDIINQPSINKTRDIVYMRKKKEKWEK